MPHSTRTAKGVLGGLAGLVGLSVVAGVLVTATVTPAIAVTGATASNAIGLFEELPSDLEIDRPMEPTTIYYTSPDGTPVQLARFFDQNRIPVTFDQVAPIMFEAVLSSEDKNFYKHGGVDLVGTTKALIDNLRGTSTRGGSSISQQYVKNVLLQDCERGIDLGDPDRSKKLEQCWLEASASSGSKGIQRKLQEMRYALQIEKKYSKNDILLGYLNLANFGGTTYGIEAAAQRYFGATAATLSISQAAILAGMVQNPNSYRIDQPEGSMYDSETDTLYNSAEDGYAETLTRRNYVLERLLIDGKINQEQYDASYAEPITPNIVPPSSGCAAAERNAYFCQYVKATLESDPAFGATPEERRDNLLRGGLDIYTSLSAPIQDAGNVAMSEYAPAAIEGMNFGAAGVTIESKTGRILAITQNTVFTEEEDLAAQPGYSGLVYGADYDHGASSGKPVGSTYKIFTLIDWLEKGNSLNESLNGTNRLFNKMKCGSTPVPFGSEIVKNAGGIRGYNGTPLTFTENSLNSGYFAMAERLDLCDINKVAERMGVHLGDMGKVTDENVPFDVLGSKNIAPIQMASAIGTIGNGGTYCVPRAIDRIVGQDGTEIPVPASTCTQVLTPEVANTAAYALERVMTNGTGGASQTDDSVPLIGKTGTHNDDQTTMITASTETATAVWVGNVDGFADLYDFSAGGVNLTNTRHYLTPALQGAANAIYGGNAFPGPASNLVRRVLTDLPNVVGMAQDAAVQTLENAGFSVTVGEPVDSELAPGTIAAQDPGAGQVAGGTTVTISPSNGQGAKVPNVAGDKPADAVAKLQAAGFTNVSLGQCTEGSGGPDGSVTSSNPPAGTMTAKNTPIVLNYKKQTC